MSDQTKDVPSEPPPSYEETLAQTYGGQPSYPANSPYKPPDQPVTYGYPPQGVTPPVGGGSGPSAPYPGYPPQVSQYPTNAYAPYPPYPGTNPPYPQQQYSTPGGQYTHQSVSVMAHRNQNRPNQFIAPGITAQDKRRKFFLAAISIVIFIIIVIIIISIV